MTADIKFPLKLKVNDDGNAILHDGKPVYVDQNNEEVALDPPRLWADLKTANSESAGRRKKLEEMEATIAEITKAWEGLTPEEARKAMETVKNYTDKQMVEAGEVDRIKQEVKVGYEGMLKQQKEEYEKALKGKDDVVGLKEAQIRDLLVRGAFDRSNFLREKTFIPPVMANAYYGQFFKVQEVNGQLMAIGMIDGKPIMSKAHPGEIASTEEAIEILVNNDPQKDSFLRNQGGGSGAFNPDGSPNEPETDLVSSMYPSLAKKK